jgi:hypothetical protein
VRCQVCGLVPGPKKSVENWPPHLCSCSCSCSCLLFPAGCWLLASGSGSGLLLTAKLSHRPTSNKTGQLCQCQCQCTAGAGGWGGAPGAAVGPSNWRSLFHVPCPMSHPPHTHTHPAPRPPPARPGAQWGWGRGGGAAAAAGLRAAGVWCVTYFCIPVLIDKPMPRDLYQGLLSSLLRGARTCCPHEDWLVAA